MYDDELKMREMKLTSPRGPHVFDKTLWVSNPPGALDYFGN